MPPPLGVSRLPLARGMYRPHPDNPSTGADGIHEAAVAATFLPPMGVRGWAGPSCSSEIGLTLIWSHTVWGDVADPHLGANLFWFVLGVHRVSCTSWSATGRENKSSLRTAARSSVAWVFPMGLGEHTPFLMLDIVGIGIIQRWARCIR